MITINVFGEIASSQTQAMMEAWGLPLQSLSVDNVRAALEAAPDDPEVTLNIDSVGGDVSEGFKIYDLLRTSGKTIYANIVGGCHSMAVILLLSAPAENRSGARNLRALIHRVYTEAPGAISSDDAMDIAEDLLREQSAILDIYVDRTGQPREKLEEVMKQERQLDAREMLELGFISKITPYNTNQFKTKPMKKNVFSQMAERLAALRNRVGINPMNYDFKDVDGNVVFRTDKEDDSLAVGDRVEVTGEEDGGIFTLEDGRVITIEDGVVTKIDEMRDGSEEPVNELIEIVDALANRLEALEAKYNTLRSSGYTPANRLGSGAKKVPATNSLEAVKEEAQEKRKKYREAGKIR